jgi:hypothetical protein
VAEHAPRVHARLRGGREPRQLRDRGRLAHVPVPGRASAGRSGQQLPGARSEERRAGLLR